METTVVTAEVLFDFEDALEVLLSLPVLVVVVVDPASGARVCELDRVGGDRTSDKVGDERGGSPWARTGDTIR